MADENPEAKAKRYILTSLMRPEALLEKLRNDLNVAGIVHGEADGSFWIEFRDAKELKKAQDILKLANLKVYR